MTSNAQRVSAAHLNVYCLSAMLAKPRLAYDWLRFDSNDDCNLRCVYCHNPRSKSIMDLSDFGQFLEANVDQIDNFQFGCRMEPTLDFRLIDFMEKLQTSDARPQRSVVLQTNGILLHRHDSNRMIAAGLTDIQVSIDTMNADVFASLRGGAKIGKILRNIRNFSQDHPGVGIKFVVTVAQSNLPYIEELVAFGVEIGAKAVIVREMFHTPGVPHVDDNKMAKLVLGAGEFVALVERLQVRFSSQLHLNCIDSAGIKVYNSGVRAHSYATQH